MLYSRVKVLKIMKSWVGAKQGGKTHKMIIDTFNSIKPLPDGWAMTYTAPWCATTVSAAFHKAGYDKIFPSSANCVTMVNKAKKMGIWVENDGFTPRPGDIILYDWDDSGKGDNKGNPDHVGMVEKVVGSTITVIEGNKGVPSACARRTMHVDGRYIRGYIVPKYTTTRRKKFVAALEEVGDGIIKYKFKYSRSGLKSTYYTAKKKDRRTDCATSVSWAMQDAGVLPEGKRIWLNDKVNGSGAAYIKKSKHASVKYPRKTLSQYEKNLRKGDICGFKFGNSQHTMVYLGNNKKGEPLFFSCGGGDIKNKKLYPVKKESYNKRKIGTLIRIKANDIVSDRF